MEITFGGYAMPLILSLILSFAYKVAGAKIDDRFKAVIAVVAGLALGNLAIAYKGLQWTVPVVVDHSVYGFIVGLSAIGLYELQRTVTNPRGRGGA